MAPTRAQLHALIEALPDDQVEVLLAVAEALRKGSAIASARESTETDEEPGGDPAVSRPDIVNQLANGWTEEIHIKKHHRPDGSQSRVRRLRDANGVTQEVWHEVLARDGTILHGPHLKYRRQEPDP